MMDIHDYNRQAWDTLVQRKNRWTVPVSSATIAAARDGQWNVVLTPVKPVPRNWFPPLPGCDVLGLASGGGQQGPILAAAGANVTVLDQSERQLAQDQFVARRDGLTLSTVQGDMANLHAFADHTFDLVFHPCSNCYVEDVQPVWRECFRVLRPGGILMAGFSNPSLFIFDAVKLEAGELAVRNTLPYSELTDLDAAERQKFIDESEPLMFGHTLQDQIGGQMAAGLTLTDMFEDSDPDNVLSRYLATYLATRAIKPAGAHERTSK